MGRENIKLGWAAKPEVLKEGGEGKGGGETDYFGECPIKSDHLIEVSLYTVV